MKTALFISIVFVLSINYYTAIGQIKDDNPVKTSKIGGLGNIVDGLDVKDANAAFKLLVDAFVHGLEKKKMKKFKLEHKIYESISDFKKDIENKSLSFFHSTSIVYHEVNARKEFIPFLTGSTGNGNKFIRYVLVTNIKNDYNNPNDLINQKICLTQKIAGEIGFYWINTLLRENLKNKDFKSIEYQTIKQNETELLLSVFFGKNKFAIVSEEIYNLASELNPSLKSKIKIIEKSKPLINGIFAYRKNSDSESFKTISDVAVTLHKDNSGKQILELFKLREIVVLSEADLNETEYVINKYNKYFK